MPPKEFQMRNDNLATENLLIDRTTDDLRAHFRSQFDLEHNDHDNSV